MDVYAVIVHEAEDGGYWAEVPQLPGCVSQGESLDELKENILDAIRACVESYAEDDDVPPLGGTFTWTLAVPNGAGDTSPALGAAPRA
ncbi:MAG: hypothetical protein GEU28_05180 [Dehalococcoidia bacterium]|nr:hypothetical protein [Dehalococcoidia bacterium]